MNNLQIIFLCLLVYASAGFYRYTNTPQKTFEVWASDQVEHTVKCYPFRMEIIEWDSLIIITSDTQKVIQEITRHYNGLPVVFIFGECVELTDSIGSTKVLYQLIEGADCMLFDNEYLLTLY